MSASDPMITALERRERRPSGTLAFLAALFALPIATCGGIGASKAADASRGIVQTQASELRPGSAVADGTYVSFEQSLRRVASDCLPVGGDRCVVARDTTLYSVIPLGDVLVASSSADLEREPPGTRVEGQLCSSDAALACSMDRGVKEFLRAEERRSGRRMRVVMHGAKPADDFVEAGIGLGVAGVLLVVLVVVLAFIARGRRGPHVSIERTVAMRDAGDARRIHERLGPRFRLAHEGPDVLVLLTGVPASRAQLVGAFQPDEYPQRVEIRLGAGGYRGGSAHVRVTEIFAQPAGVPAMLLPSVRAALEATLARVTQALEAA